MTEDETLESQTTVTPLTTGADSKVKHHQELVHTHEIRGEDPPHIPVQKPVATMRLLMQQLMQKLQKQKRSHGQTGPKKIRSRSVETLHSRTRKAEVLTNSSE